MKFCCLSRKKRKSWPKQSDEYMVNTRDGVLHLRTYAPADGQDIKALVFFLHGYEKAEME